MLGSLNYLFKNYEKYQLALHYSDDACSNQFYITCAKRHFNLAIQTHRSKYWIVSLPFKYANLSVSASIRFVLHCVVFMARRTFSKIQRNTKYLAFSLGSVAVLILFHSSRWIESLGGFPAIGSGQGIIKYFALFGITAYLNRAKFSEHVVIALNYLPVFLVLLFIGGVKFTGLEAKGIEDLVASSPFISWMYRLFDIRTASNLISVYDLLALILLGLCYKYPRLFMPGFFMAFAVFAMTQSFLITWPDALSSETMLTYGVQFLVKDVWFIANMLILYAYHHAHKAN